MMRQELGNGSFLQCETVKQNSYLNCLNIYVGFFCFQVSMAGWMNEGITPTVYECINPNSRVVGLNINLIIFAAKTEEVNKIYLIKTHSENYF